MYLVTMILSARVDGVNLYLVIMILGGDYLS